MPRYRILDILPPDAFEPQKSEFVGRVIESKYPAYAAVHGAPAGCRSVWGSVFDTNIYLIAAVLEEIS